MSHTNCRQENQKAPFVLVGGAVGGRPVLGVSGVRPSAVEQSASEAAGLQLGERKYSYSHN